MADTEITKLLLRLRDAQHAVGTDPHQLAKDAADTIEALLARVAELTKAIKVAIDASQTELNLGNYDHYDVCALQTEAVQIWDVLRAALSREGGAQ